MRRGQKILIKVGDVVSIASQDLWTPSPLKLAQDSTYIMGWREYHEDQGQLLVTTVSTIMIGFYFSIAEPTLVVLTSEGETWCVRQEFAKRL
jgi:hypothetical protein